MQIDQEAVICECNSAFKQLIEADPGVEREDTCRGIIRVLGQLEDLLAKQNALPMQLRSANYHVTLNNIGYLCEMADVLLRTNYSFACIKPLLAATASMEANIVLQDVKYMDKRTRLYLTICAIYEEAQYPQAAVNLLTTTLKKYKELKELHDLSPPVPSYVTTILQSNMRLLKIFLIKYSLQAGVLSSSDWRKKLDQEFGDDTQAKMLCMVESLRTETRKGSNIFLRNWKNFKEVVLQASYELVKPHLELIAKALTQQKQKIERQLQFRSSNGSLTQENINAEIKKRQEVEEKYIKQAEYQKASEMVPFQVHVELLYYALELKNKPIFSELVESAKVRAELRRIEVPYLNDVAIIASETKHPNLPNGYQKVGDDLNAANLRAGLKKLRKDAPVIVAVPSVPAPAATGKDQKGAPPLPVVQRPIQIPGPTEEELQKLRHKYVYLLVKKSMDSEKAVYGLDIVMGHQETGPVGYNDTRRVIVPYIQESMKAQVSEVSQYHGVRESTRMVPYIILRHSSNSLSSDLQKMTVLTDVRPVIETNPMVPPPWGYTKVPVDLRQVPSQFIRATGNQYVFLSYKTDQKFHNYKRHLDVLAAYSELEQSEQAYSAQKIVSVRSEKLLQLELNYDITKLETVFQVLEQSVSGQLGQEYYMSRVDFLSYLCYTLWSKFLKGPLLQFEYVEEQRLNGEVVDYDYQHYRDIIYECRKIYLYGLKVINLILLNNFRADIVLLTRVTLQLVRLLEDQGRFKEAADASALCLERIRDYRDQYLGRGPDSANTKLLPFCVTSSATRIQSTLKQMKEQYLKDRNQMKRLKRIKQRQESKQSALSEKQLEEEQFQLSLLTKRDQVDQAIDKIVPSQSQLISLLTGMELDLLNLHFRVALKYAQEMKMKVEDKHYISGIKESELSGFANTLKQKLTLRQGKTYQGHTKNIKHLQNTLVKAEKLSPIVPALAKSEKKLIESVAKNPYKLALLMMNLAAMNSESEDKKYYLLESFKSVQSAYSLENSMCTAAVKNSVFIFSTIWESEVNSIIQPLPESLRGLYEGLWTTNDSDVAGPPILVGKNSRSIRLRLPPFHQTALMSVYGKQSANGVDVSTNNNQLSGTGVRLKIRSIATISELQPDTLYCFAVTAADDSKEVQQIGRTSEDLSTANPLHISMLTSYLAKVSYQLGEFDLALKATELVIGEFCTKTLFNTQEGQPSINYRYSFNEQALKSASLLELRCLSQALFVAALCQRRKLQETTHKMMKVEIREKQAYMTNLLMLSGLLFPVSGVPNLSLPFMIPDSQPLFKSLMLSMVPSKWMSPQLRHLGVQVMRGVLKWGLANNEVTLARRCVYKWGERKWLLLSKMVQVEEKKETKKGAKEKDPQVKLIDKIVRVMIQKTPYVIDSLEDTLAEISDEYSDLVASFVERSKQMLGKIAQYTDNPPTELEALQNSLNLKVQFCDMMRDPLNSIKKIPSSSAQFLEYNCKIAKRALQKAEANQIKPLQAKIDELEFTENVPQEITLTLKIFQLMHDAIKNGIPCRPSSKKELTSLMEKTGRDYSKAISIFSEFEKKRTELTTKLSSQLSMVERHKDHDYLSTWLSELNRLKATTRLMCLRSLDCKHRVRAGTSYSHIETISLEDLLKVQHQLGAIDKTSWSYEPAALADLEKILERLCRSAHLAFSCNNWWKLNNIFKIIFNILTYFEMAPFYHLGSSVWQWLALLSVYGIGMLEKVRDKGLYSLPQRYRAKMANTQLFLIGDRLGGEPPELDRSEAVEVFQPTYEQTNLNSSTAKVYWFTNNELLDMESLSGVVGYSIMSLRLQGQYDVLIDICRQFSNVTQHRFSTNVLPFMLESQNRLLASITQQLKNLNLEMDRVKADYEREKGGKRKRQAQITGEKMPYEIEFEEKSAKLSQPIRLLTEQTKHVENQAGASKNILTDIARDLSKASQLQREQKKFLMELGADEERMYRQYGEETKLARNRNRIGRDIISKYDEIYAQLKESKTSKDPAAETTNRHQVGNLYYALGNAVKAREHWNDALASIFKKVNPIANFKEILSQSQPFMLCVVNEQFLLQALILLFKISCYTSQKDLETQRQCAQFGASICFQLFKTDGSHPKTFLGFAAYRLRQPLIDSLTHSNLGQLLSALEYLLLKLLDSSTQQALKALPMACFLQHLALDVAKSVGLSVRAKIYKTLLLVECGCVSEAAKCLQRIHQSKDVPLLWLQLTDAVRFIKGDSTPVNGPQFNETKSPFENQNKEAIQEVKKLINTKEQTTRIGLYNSILFNVAKTRLISKIYQAEQIDQPELNEQRCQQLNQQEQLLREQLKALSVLDEYHRRFDEVNLARIVQNQTGDQLKPSSDQATASLSEWAKTNNLDAEAIKLYDAECKGNSFDVVLRLETMCRVRFYLYRIAESRNLLCNGFFILKNGVLNMQLYSYGMRAVQSGQDPELKPTAPVQPANTKKDDKKAAKKEQEVAPVASVPAFKEAEIKNAKQHAAQKPQRISVDMFWIHKLLFELATLLYRECRFKDAVGLGNKLIESGKRFNDDYVVMTTQAIILRCKLRLGSHDPSAWKETADRMKTAGVEDWQFISFCMDLAELHADKPEYVPYADNALKAMKAIWERFGMSQAVQNVGLSKLTRDYAGEVELTTEQEDLIRGTKKNQKKGGKDDKKPPKKQDPKKKDDSGKIEYKVNPLYKYEECNLLEEQKLAANSYALDPPFNQSRCSCYHNYTILYVKCHLLVLRLRLRHQLQTLLLENEAKELENLLSVVTSHFATPSWFRLNIQSNIALIYKEMFVKQLKALAEANKIRKPYQDLPLNEALVKVPAYTQFQSKSLQLLNKSAQWYKRFLAGLKGAQCFIEGAFSLENVVWQAADLHCMLAQYRGREGFKYFPEQSTEEFARQKRTKSLNYILQAWEMLKLNERISTAKNDITRNYSELAMKGLDPNVKIDEDIQAQLLNADKQTRKSYSSLQAESVKAKLAVSGLDVLTLLLKLWRESECMTFSNLHLQSMLSKCQRILMSLGSFKEKCQFSWTDPNPKKQGDTFIEKGQYVFKSLGKGDCQRFLYILSSQKDQNKLLFGRISFGQQQLSIVLQYLYQLLRKMGLSDKKSENCRKRDYEQHKQDFNRCLIDIGASFLPALQTVPVAAEVDLNKENVRSVIEILESNSLTTPKNLQLGDYFERLHCEKYQQKTEAS